MISLSGAIERSRSFKNTVFIDIFNGKNFQVVLPKYIIRQSESFPRGTYAEFFCIERSGQLIAEKYKVLSKPESIVCVR